MTSITLKGRKIPLLYTTYEMKTIQEEIAPIGQALKIVLGRNPDDENDMSLYGGAAHIEAASKLIRILGNAGLEEKGEEPDLTAKWVLRNMRPALILPFAIATMAEINEGNMMEVKPDEKGPVDEILEEERAKKPQGN
jgi:hypothetical protein